MKKFIISASIVFVICSLLVWASYFNPQVETYGKTTLTYNEAVQSFVICVDGETMPVKELFKSDEEMSSGMPVSFLKHFGEEDLKVCAGHIDEPVLSKMVRLRNTRNLFLCCFIFFGAILMLEALLKSSVKEIPVVYAD